MSILFKNIYTEMTSFSAYTKKQFINVGVRITSNNGNVLSFCYYYNKRLSAKVIIYLHYNTKSLTFAK